jgi:hypothetical protein
LTPESGIHHSAIRTWQYFKTTTRTLFSIKTRLKVKGIPQGIPTTSFIEEVSKTLPPTQGTYPALCKQQLVKEYPESKFPLPSETTQFHVFNKELEHPVPIHNLTSPKSLKPESSPSTQADDLVWLSRSLVR